MEQLGSHWTDFHEIWYLGTFRKSVKEIQVSLKSDKNNQYFTYTFISRSILLRNEKCWDESCTENQNTHFMFSNYFFRISSRLCGKMWRCRVAHDTNDNMAHAHCMLCTLATQKKHTHTICMLTAFSTATVIVQTRLCVTSLVPHLSCWYRNLLEKTKGKRPPWR